MKRKPGSIKSKLSSSNVSVSQQVELLDLTKTNLSSVPKELNNVFVKHLILNKNYIRQAVLHSNLVGLENLEIQNNGMKKLTIKKQLNPTLQFVHLKQLNISSNQLDFIELSTFPNLQELNCSHNNLSTVIFPTSLISVDCSNNKFTNIPYSLLANRIFPYLKQIRINNNNLYDVKLNLSSEEQCPQLQTLDCENNEISTIYSIPKTLKHLHLGNNSIIFDRGFVNEIIKLRDLSFLDVQGNSIDEQCKQFIESRLPNTHILMSEVQASGTKKESPYKLYVEDNDKNWMFTLGDCNDDSDLSLLDNQFNSLSLKNSQAKKIKEKQLSKTEKVKKENNTPSKYHLKVKQTQCLRYHNHYCHFMSQLLESSFIPPKPISHQQKSSFLSFRIDPPSPGFKNQYSIFNEMFESRGGVHYVRKVFNWEKTGVPPNDLKKSHQIMFINKDFTKSEFQSLCDGQYDILQTMHPKVRNLLGWQPSSFTCYHVLLRLKINQEKDWGCMYLVESAHL